MARKGHNRPASLVQIAGSGSTYPDDGSSPVGSNEWNANRDTTGVHGFTKKRAVGPQFGILPMLISDNAENSICPDSSLF